MEQSLLYLLTGNPQDVRVIRDPAGAPMLPTGQPITEKFAAILEKAGAAAAAHIVEQKDKSAKDVIVETLVQLPSVEASLEQSPLINGIMPLQQPPFSHAPTQESFVAAVSFTPEVAERLRVLESNNITKVADVELVDGDEMELLIENTPRTMPVDEIIFSEDVIINDVIEHNIAEHGTVGTFDADAYDVELPLKQAQAIQFTDSEQSEQMKVIDVEGDEVLAVAIDAPIIQQQVQQTKQIEIPQKAAARHVAAAPLVQEAIVKDVPNAEPLLKNVIKTPYRTISHIEQFADKPVLFGKQSATDVLISKTDITDIKLPLQEMKSETMPQSLQDFSAILNAERSGASNYSQPVRFVVPTPEMMTMHPPQQVAVHIGQALKDGQRNISIRLHPEEMGRVDIRMEVSSDQVTVKVTTETREAYELLRADRAQLEAILKESGYEADSNTFEFSHQQDEQKEQQKTARAASPASDNDVNAEKTQELEHDPQTGILLATTGLNIKV